MNLHATNNDWIEANQKFLVAEFARIKNRFIQEATQDAQAAIDVARGAMPAPSAIDRLTDIFGLSTFERDILLLCAGVEMDSEFSNLCANAQNDTRQTYASLSVAMAVLENPHWSASSPVRPLRHWRLLEVNNDTGLANARLRVDERVLHYLAGINYLDARLQMLLETRAELGEISDEHSEIIESLLADLQKRQGPVPSIHLQGDDRDGQLDIAAGVASGLGLQLYILHADDIPTDAAERDAFAVLWQRESALLSGGLLIECQDNRHNNEISKLVGKLGGLIFISSQESLELNANTRRFTVKKPGAREQKRLWEMALGEAAIKLNGSLDGVAAQYRLSAKTIQSTGDAIRTSIEISDKPDEVLWRACRALGRLHLDELAERIEPVSTWTDLILPDHQKAILRQVASNVRNRMKVCSEWGFANKSARGLGLSSLFAGESGTGKTMAAEVLANELYLDLYRIDLSAVVSKYIGETEKNLRKVFDAAENSGAILLFDEADALFGKRSEVKDSHDRYANIEVSYLLQRMEAYNGLAILTTNLKTALDTAFQRRLRFVVQFTFPDAMLREAIWRSIFPDNTPLENLDYRKLAQLQVTGGNIRNIALNAAFLAADANTPVRMIQLLQAAHIESEKRERPLNDAEIRGWV